MYLKDSFTSFSQMDKKELVLRIRKGESLAGIQLINADLQHIDLSGADLHGAILIGAKFNGSILKGVNLNQARLNGASFKKADLTEAMMVSATLKDTIFEGAKLSKTNLSYTHLAGLDMSNLDIEGGIFKNSDLSMANLSHSNLKGADLEKAILNEANLEGARLIGANLNNALLHRANLADAHLQNANFLHADLRYARLNNASLMASNMEMAYLKKAEFNSANLLGANLFGAILKGANLINANLKEANLGSTDFDSANLQKASLESAYCRGANFRNSFFIGAILKGGNFQDCNFSFADLTGAFLEEALFDDAIFESAKLAFATMKKSSFINSRLISADLTGSDLSEANLSKANLSSSILDGANFTNAVLKGTRLFQIDLKKAIIEPKNLELALTDELPSSEIEKAKLKASEETSNSEFSPQESLKEIDLASQELRERIKKLEGSSRAVLDLYSKISYSTKEKDEVLKNFQSYKTKLRQAIKSKADIAIASKEIKEIIAARKRGLSQLESELDILTGDIERCKMDGDFLRWKKLEERKNQVINAIKNIKRHIKILETKLKENMKKSEQLEKIEQKLNLEVEKLTAQLEKIQDYQAHLDMTAALKQALEEELKIARKSLDELTNAKLELEEKIRQVQTATPKKGADGKEIERSRETNLFEILNLVDILQMLSMNGKSGLLTIKRNKELAQIYLHKGDVINSRVGDLKGKEAFFYILTWNDGKIIFDKEMPPTERIIKEPTQHLLLEGMRLLDEQRRGQTG